MNILELLNSGALHSNARMTRPDCVDRSGSIHRSAERARFVDWLASAKASWGDNPETWTDCQREEYRSRYIPSH